VGMGSWAVGGACTRAAAAASTASHPPPLRGVGLDRCIIFNYIINIIVFFLSNLSRSVQSPHGLCLFFSTNISFCIKFNKSVDSMQTPYGVCAESTWTGGQL
jgi:hypothetical protein